MDHNGELDKQTKEQPNYNAGGSHPESLRMKYVRYGIHQVYPGVVNSLGTPRRWKPTDPGSRTRMNRIPDPGTCMARSAVMPGATVGNKSEMPHEMLLRDSESTVHKIKILM